MKKINFAIIGCGRIAYKHLMAINELKEHANVIAVCDIIEEKAIEKAKEYNVSNYYTDYHEMIQKHPEIEIVNVCVPSGLHADVVVDIAKYGRHIITEKPMALRVEDCDRMINACKETGVQLFVIYQNRYNLAVQEAKRVVEQGELGKFVLGTVRVRWCRMQDYYEMDDWHGTWKMDGGVMSQQATHHLDLLQYFFGEPETISCMSDTRLLNIEVEDTSAAILRFKSGAIGAFEATVAARPKNLEGSLSILGENGSIVIGGQAVNEIKSWSFTNISEEESKEICKKWSRKVANVYGTGHVPNIMDIIEVVRDNKESSIVCDSVQGKKNVQLLAALYESAACDGEVKKMGSESRKSLLGKEK